MSKLTDLESQAISDRLYLEEMLLKKVSNIKNIADYKYDTLREMLERSYKIE